MQHDFYPANLPRQSNAQCTKQRKWSKTMQNSIHRSPPFMFKETSENVVKNLTGNFTCLYRQEKRREQVAKVLKKLKKVHSSSKESSNTIKSEMVNECSM